MNIYVAGPMSGYPDHNFPAFNNAAAQLRADGHVVFNPAELPRGLGGLDTKQQYREYLGIDLGWLCAHADAIALVPGWAESIGARAEFAVALALKLEVIEL